MSDFTSLKNGKLQKLLFDFCSPLSGCFCLYIVVLACITAFARFTLSTAVQYQYNSRICWALVLTILCLILLFAISNFSYYVQSNTWENVFSMQSTQFQCVNLAFCYFINSCSHLTVSLSLLMVLQSAGLTEVSTLDRNMVMSY